MLLSEVKDFVSKNEGKFTHREEIIELKDGSERKVDIFNYGIGCGYTDFNKKISGEFTAHELRGLTFTSETEYYLSMPKFFNLNETKGSMYDDLKNKKIIDVMEKADGSLIMFVPFVLKDGSVQFKAKTKKTFHSEQAQLANEYLENNDNLYNLLIDAKDDGDVLLFEYVSPLNRIVLKYDHSDLKCLMIRNSVSGDILTENFMQIVCDEYGVSSVDSFNKNIDEIIEIQKSNKEIEGFVCLFEDNKLVKFKTDWYFDIHKIRTSFTQRENDIIAAILNENIDDYLSELSDDNELRLKIEYIINKVKSHHNSLYKEVVSIANNMKEMELKDFAYKYKNHSSFSWFLVRLKRGLLTLDDFDDKYKDFMLKKTRKLSDARLFLEAV